MILNPIRFLRLRRQLLHQIRARDFDHALATARLLGDKKTITLMAACRIKQLLEEAVQ